MKNKTKREKRIEIKGRNEMLQIEMHGKLLPVANQRDGGGGGASTDMKWVG